MDEAETTAGDEQKTLRRDTFWTMSVKVSGSGKGARGG